MEGPGLSLECVASPLSFLVKRKIMTKRKNEGEPLCILFVSEILDFSMRYQPQHYTGAVSRLICSKSLLNNFIFNSWNATAILDPYLMYSFYSPSNIFMTPLPQLTHKYYNSTFTLTTNFKLHYS